MSHMPASTVSRQLSWFNVKDYGAVADGVTDDTEAIQAAITAAAAQGGNRGHVVYFPASPTPYMFTNLTMYSYQTLEGCHITSCQLKRIAGSTGTALRERTVAEGNGGGGSGIVIRNICFNGNSTVGDGLWFGDQVPGAQFTSLASLQNVSVFGFVGTGIKMNANAIACFYVWSYTNTVGFHLTAGGGNSFFGLWAENNSLYELRIAGTGNSFFGVQTERDANTNPSILVESINSYFAGVFLGIGGNAQDLIQIAVGANGNQFQGVHLDTLGHTFANVIRNMAYPGDSTGSVKTDIHQYVMGDSTGTARWYVNQSTGAANTEIGDATALGGPLTIGGALDHDGTTVGFYGTAPVAKQSITALTDSTGGTANNTLQAIPDPADAPATADALRDDLVANALPAIRNDFADLAAKVNALRTILVNLGLTT